MQVQEQVDLCSQQSYNNTNLQSRTHNASGREKNFEVKLHDIISKLQPRDVEKSTNYKTVPRIVAVSKLNDPSM